MKNLFILLVFSFNTLAFSAEVSWETLKTLDIDPKTKSPIAKGELKKILGKIKIL